MGEVYDCLWYSLVVVVPCLLFFVVFFRVHAWWVRSCYAPHAAAIRALSRGDIWDVHVGYGSTSYIDGNGVTKEVWSDAPLLVVVGKNKNPIGLIGLQKHGTVLSVVQMQGIREANFRGVPVGNRLLPVAEEIASALQYPLRILPAHRNDYFDLPPRYMSFSAHQRRLVNIYDTAAKSAGYVLSHRGKWYTKQSRRNL